MLYSKISCEHKMLNSQTITKTLFNMATNKYGFIHDNDITIFFDKSHLLCYDISDLPSRYATYPITYSAGWLFIQKLLNQLDETTKSYIITIINLYPSKLLSIIDAILSFPVNHDIICVMVTIIFTNLEKPTVLCTLINNKWVPFCIKFGKTCDYLINFTMGKNVMKQLINQFMATKMDKDVDIMCASEFFTTFILYNEFYHIKFTMLIFDRICNKVYMCLIDTNFPPLEGSTTLGKFCSTIVVDTPLFDFKKMYYCTDIYYSSDNTFKLAKKRKNLLINRIIKIASRNIRMGTWHLGNDELFY